MKRHNERTANVCAFVENNREGDKDILSEISQTEKKR